MIPETITIKYKLKRKGAKLNVVEVEEHELDLYRKKMNYRAKTGNYRFFNLKKLAFLSIGSEVIINEGK